MQNSLVVRIIFFQYKNIPDFYVMQLFSFLDTENNAKFLT